MTEQEQEERHKRDKERSEEISRVIREHRNNALVSVGVLPLDCQFYDDDCRLLDEEYAAYVEIRFEETCELWIWRDCNVKITPDFVYAVAGHLAVDRGIVALREAFLTRAKRNLSLNISNRCREGKKWD